MQMTYPIPFSHVNSSLTNNSTAFSPTVIVPLHVPERIPENWIAGRLSITERDLGRLDILAREWKVQNSFVIT